MEVHPGGGVRVGRGGLRADDAAGDPIGERSGSPTIGTKHHALGGHHELRLQSRMVWWYGRSL